jgi:hypothetical protein
VPSDSNTCKLSNAELEANGTIANILDLPLTQIASHSHSLHELLPHASHT